MERLRSVKIGPFVYSIEYTDNSIFEYAGMINFLEQKTYIRESLPNTGELDTIIHEVIHGIHHVMGLTDGSSEEEFTRGGATGLLMVLRDNPDLLQFIIDVLEIELEGE